MSPEKAGIVTELAFCGPERGADRAVLLAHGAGSDLHASALVVAADALAAAGVPSLRFNFPYRSAGRRAPDRAAVLLGATRQAARSLADRTMLPADRVVLGGRSMGGRYGSLLAGDAEDPRPALALLLLGYPLHPPGKPEQPRVEHFPRLTMPVLFVAGTNDAFGTPDELRSAARRIPGPVRWSWVPTADHSFKPKRRESGLSIDEALETVAAATVEFVLRL